MMAVEQNIYFMHAKYDIYISVDMLILKLEREGRILSGKEVLMEKKQAAAPMTVMMGADAFAEKDGTCIYWLGSAGILINARGTCIMIDPVLENSEADPALSEAGFPFLVPPPVRCADIPRLDAVLYTHADYDHMAPGTAKALLRLDVPYYGTEFTCFRLQQDFGIGLQGAGRTIPMFYAQETVIGNISVRLTHCVHNWRANRPEFDWEYGPDDCCGFYITTPDGTVWAPGDSTLQPWHFEEPAPDLMFFDISADPFHFGTENAIRLANHYGTSDLILYHYGTYLAPEKPAFNADPAWTEGRITDPARLHILAPGEKFRLRKKVK